MFNGFLVVSALALTFVVLVREERYAMAQLDNPPPIIELIAPQASLAGTVESMGLRPD